MGPAANSIMLGMMSATPSTDATPAARVTIHRTSPEDAQQRQVIMSLDGQTIGTLMYEQTLTRTVTPGHHSLRAYNTLVWKTLEFDAKPGDDLHFTIVNKTVRGMLWLIAVLGVGLLTVTLTPGRPGEKTPDKPM